MPTVNDILRSEQTSTQEVVNALKEALKEESSLELYTDGLSTAALLNFAKALENNKTVTDLTVLGDEGTLTDETLEALTIALMNNQHVTHLCFNSSIHANIISKFAQLLKNNQPPLKKVTILRIGDLNMPHLWPRNSLKPMAIALEKNNTLETLEISHTIRLDSEEMEALAVALRKHSHLSQLKIRIKEEEVHRLVEALKVNQTLSHLDCAVNRLHSVGMPLFVSFLKDNNTLKSLDLSANDLDSTDASILVDALKYKNVTKLNLCRNKIGAKGAQVLADFLKENTVLSSLNLGDNDINDEGVKALATVLETNNKLKELHLEGNNLGPQASEALAKTLKKNHALENLSLFCLHSNMFTLAEAIQYNHGLTKLKLHGNINGERLEILSTGLQNNDTLTSLDLAINKIRDADVPSLIELLRNTPNLTALDISNNNINVEGARLLATFLETNPTRLTSLKLDNHLANYGGLKTFTEALKKNTTLTELIFSSRIDGDYSNYIAIEALLKVNKTLTNISIDPPLSLSKVSQEAYVNIIRALKENKIRAEKEGVELLAKKIQEDVPMFPAVIGKIVAEYAGSAKRFTVPVPNPLMPKIDSLSKYFKEKTKTEKAGELQEYIDAKIGTQEKPVKLRNSMYFGLLSNEEEKLRVATDLKRNMQSASSAIDQFLMIRKAMLANKKATGPQFGKGKLESILTKMSEEVLSAIKDPRERAVADLSAYILTIDMEKAGRLFSIGRTNLGRKRKIANDLLNRLIYRAQLGQLTTDWGPLKPIENITESYLNDKINENRQITHHTLGKGEGREEKILTDLFRGLFKKAPEIKLTKKMGK